jgi:hypothetical protein
MKRIILLAFILGLFNPSIGQNVRKTADGNYVAISTAKTKDNGKQTGKTYTDAKGKVYPVFITAKGKLFITRTSAKTGKDYRFYLKID